MLVWFKGMVRVELGEAKQIGDSDEELLQIQP